MLHFRELSAIIDLTDEFVRMCLYVDTTQADELMFLSLSIFLCGPDISPSFKVFTQSSFSIFLFYSKFIRLNWGNAECPVISNIDEHLYWLPSKAHFCHALSQEIVDFYHRSLDFLFFLSIAIFLSSTLP